MNTLKTGLRAVLITSNKDLKLTDAIFSKDYADFMTEVDKYAPGESGLNHSYGIAYFDIRNLRDLDQYIHIMDELSYVNLKFCPIGTHVNISTEFKYNMVDCTLDKCNETDLMSFTTNLFASAGELSDKVWQANEKIRTEFKESSHRFWQWLWS